jgi:hypothetical protein
MTSNQKLSKILQLLKNFLRTLQDGHAVEYNFLLGSDNGIFEEKKDFKSLFFCLCFFSISN